MTYPPFMCLVGHILFFRLFQQHLTEYQSEGNVLNVLHRSLYLMQEFIIEIAEKS